MRSKYVAIALSALLVNGIHAQKPLASTSAASAVPASADSAVFATLDREIAADVAAGRYPGAAYMLAEHGRVVHSGAVGVLNAGSPAPVKADTIFRLASMSKPITAVAILMLVDQGKISLDAPVSRYIPQLADMRVAPDAGSPGGPAVVTIRDLLDHSAGLDANPAPARASMTNHTTLTTLAAAVPGWAHTQLAWQPGTHWKYSARTGFEILSRVVEVVSGMPYDRFLKEHLFTALGMKDTTFVLTDAQRARLIGLYEAKDGHFTAQPSSMNSTTYFSGAAALYSTVADYTRFAMMLAGHGQLDGVRILSPQSVDLMSSRILPLGFPGLPKGYAWGLGVRVVADPALADSALDAGSYGWSGAYGTHFWVDPKRDLVAVFAINLTNAGGAGAPTAFDFERRVMAAVEARAGR